MPTPQSYNFSLEKYDTWANAIIKEVPIIIEKIEKSCEVTEPEAKELLMEALKYLDLVNYSGESLTPSLLADYAWHEFILCTRVYAAFCERNFGKFIHHHPGGRTQQAIDQFRKTIKYYILYIGEPNELYWGPFAKEEWDASQCGSCQSIS